MPENGPVSQQQKPVGQATLSGLTKRQQLGKTKQTTFIWVAVAAATLALSLVLLQFLVKEAIFNQKIISKKQETQKILVENLKNVPELKKNVDALLADESLAALRANPEDSTLQVVLDALPTTGDTTTFSNSLYNKILKRNGANVTSVTVGSSDGTTTAALPTADDTSLNPTPQSLPFTVSLQGKQDQVKNTLVDLEKVIRPISTKKLLITVADGNLVATLTGETYYLPRTTVDLGKESITPGKP